MTNIENMEVGEKRTLSGNPDWSAAENRGAYMAAQEHTRSTGQQFSVECTHQDTPAGRKISGYTITRTK